MKRFAIILAVAAFILPSLKSEAQTVSLSTNLLDYACLGF